MSNRQSTRLASEMALLGFLRLRPMHGYEIHQMLAAPDGLDGLWRVKLSRLYAMLGRLETAGYVSPHTELQGDRPPRKVFQLTSAGQEAFLDWIASPVGQPRDMRLEFMLKLYFARQECALTAVHLVTAQRYLCDTWLHGALVAIDSTVELTQVVHRFRQGQITALSEWLEWLLSELGAEN